jgi:hypothetical protein
MPIVYTFVHIIMLVSLLMFHLISDERGTQIGGKSRATGQLRDRGSGQKKYATTMPMILRGADLREAGGPTSRLEGRAVASRPSPGVATGERNPKPLGEEERTKIEHAQEGPYYYRTLFVQLFY